MTLNYTDSTLRNTNQLPLNSSAVSTASHAMSAEVTQGALDATTADSAGSSTLLLLTLLNIAQSLPRSQFLALPWSQFLALPRS